MENPTLALCFSFLAMCCIVVSYFLKSKALYLVFQAVGIVFLVATYFFSALFFPMISLSIGLCRSLIFFAYEQKNKVTPVWLTVLIVSATAAAYVVVNVVILKNAGYLDILNLASMVLYALVMRVRNMKFVRFATLVPAALSTLYNALLGGQPFATALYIFEMAACLASILRYHVFNQKEKSSTKEEK